MYPNAQPGVRLVCWQSLVLECYELLLLWNILVCSITAVYIYQLCSFWPALSISQNRSIVILNAKIHVLHVQLPTLVCNLCNTMQAWRLQQNKRHNEQQMMDFFGKKLILEYLTGLFGHLVIPIHMHFCFFLCLLHMLVPEALFECSVMWNNNGSFGTKELYEPHWIINCTQTLHIAS